MRLSAGFIVAPLTALAACGQASGSVPDASSDLHCSVLAFYFSGQAEHDGAPTDQRRALAVVHEWYAAKLRQLTAERGESDSVLNGGAAILEAVKRDPRAMVDEAQACSARALADPEFNGFANSLR